MKRELGQAAAEKLMRFHLAHLDAYKTVAQDAGIVEYCQIRDVESVEVSVTAEGWESRKRLFQTWKNDMPLEAKDWNCIEGPEAIKVSVLALSFVLPSNLLRNTISPIIVTASYLAPLVQCGLIDLSVLLQTVSFEISRSSKFYSTSGGAYIHAQC
jgi:hypothetical protein